MSKTSVYDYLKNWFDFSFTNKDKVKPIHGIIYLWQVELNNRLRWQDKFSSPSTQTMDACGINCYASYKRAFDDLVAWGFIKIVKPSINQYQANIISLPKKIKPSKEIEPERKNAYSPEMLNAWQIIQDWLNKNVPRINQMTKPLTIDEYQNLRSRYSEDEMINTLKAMENWTKLLNYVSTFETFMYFKRNNKNG